MKIPMIECTLEERKELLTSLGDEKWDRLPRAQRMMLRQLLKLPAPVHVDRLAGVLELKRNTVYVQISQNIRPSLWPYGLDIANRSLEGFVIGNIDEDAY